MLAYVAIVFALLLVAGGSAWLIYRQMDPGIPEFSKGRLSPLERRLLREFSVLFDTSLKNKIKKQIQYFGKQGRCWQIDDEQGYRLELYENENNPMEERYCFPLTTEADLARFDFSAGKKSFVITIHGYNGRIWGWSIFPHPGKLLGNSRIRITEGEILQHPEQVQLNSDQQVQVIFREDDSLLSALLESPSIKEVRAPGNIDRLLQRLDRTNTRLPEEFIDLLRISDGMIFADGKINGSRTLLKIMNREAIFWPLAEFKNELLGVRPGDTRGRIYSMNKQERKLRRINGEFKEIIISRLDSF